MASSFIDMILQLIINKFNTCMMESVKLDYVSMNYAKLYFANIVYSECSVHFCKLQKKAH